MENLTQERDAALTIDELAARAGMSVRNLREWHGLGLIPAAEMRGRVGYYDAAVVERIETIRKLRAEGFTLPLIARMLETAGDDAPAVAELAQSLRAPFREPVAPARAAEIVAALGRLGMSEAEVEAAQADMREHTDKIAAIFERIWMERIWEPFLAAGSPEDGLAEIQRTLAQMQPMAIDAVVASFSEAMAARIETGIAREIERGG